MRHLLQILQYSVDRGKELLLENSVTMVLRNSSKDPKEGESSISQAKEESYLCELPYSNVSSTPAAIP